MPKEPVAHTFHNQHVKLEKVIQSSSYVDMEKTNLDVCTALLVSLQNVDVE